MLHCFILPKITLHRDDLDKVIKAREKQVFNIEALDKKVIDECKNIDDCELHLDNVRTQFLPSLERLLKKGRCSKEFLDLLHADVCKEELKLRNQVRGVCFSLIQTLQCLKANSSLVKETALPKITLNFYQRQYSSHFCSPLSALVVCYVYDILSPAAVLTVLCK